MTASSQNFPGAMPAEVPPLRRSLTEPVPLQAALGTIPAMTVAPVQVAAAAVIGATMADEGGSTAQEIAQAESQAGILFDAASVEAVRTAEREQAQAEHTAELEERGRQVAALMGCKRRLDAVLRLVEGRPVTDLLSVEEITAAAVDAGTSRDGIPMTLAWIRSVDLPDSGARNDRAIVQCATASGGRADLILTGEERQGLASLLDLEVRDIHAPCPTPNCGTDHDLDASDPSLFGWTRAQVAGTDELARWYCTPMCVSNALARAGVKLAAIEDQAELDGGL
ncbi:hypothetical protein ABZ890_12140 [Streptomyces sp. NPDC046984]|uniref:hypothetical protein n=1 Tax=Streptomyces sp. NPDC046984 TaxID=3155138 RepID=UPI003404B121